MSKGLVELKAMKNVKATTLNELKGLIFDTEGSFKTPYYDYNIDLGSGVYLEVYWEHKAAMFFYEGDYGSGIKNSISDYLLITYENINEIFNFKETYVTTDSEIEWEIFYSRYEQNTDFSLMKALDNLSELEVRKMLFATIRNN